METSILNKIEDVKMRLTGEPSCSALSGSTAELREDLVTKEMSLFLGAKQY